MEPPTARPWLLLIHQIPLKPSYFRVKIWRRLQRIGAVSIKNSVYALPRTEQAQEDFQWVLREILEGGGEATLCEVRLVEGLRDAEVVALFQAARDADYGQLTEELRQCLAEGAAQDRAWEADLVRFQRRLQEIAALDFFGAPLREAAEAQLAALEALARPRRTAASALKTSLRGRTWVTRKGIFIDRIASAWLIRRFIDPQARLKFVPAKGYAPEPGELRFDMFEAEYTHEGDRCTFEVLCERAGLWEPALRVLADMVHDIDLKDSKYGRPETAGVASLMLGIGMAHKDDEARLARGSAVLDDLHAYFVRKAPAGGEST